MSAIGISLDAITYQLAPTAAVRVMQRTIAATARAFAARAGGTMRLAEGQSERTPDRA